MEARFFKILPIICGILIFIAFIYHTFFKIFIIGYGLPKENELQFGTGYLKSYSETVVIGSKNNAKAYLRPVIVLTKSLNVGIGESYHCNYDYGIRDTSYCFSERTLPKEYNKKFAKIGYYYQKDFLWLKDNRRKLVTLEVNGKTVISYQDTKDKIKSERDLILFLVIFLFLMLLLSVFFNWVFSNSSNN